MKHIFIILFLLLGAVLCAAEKPNILFILADDLGYGDVACYSKESKVPTPYLDKLASEGMRFLDAHSPSTICTPSRYSLLTGRFAFRTGFNGVFTGVGGPNMIKENQLTLPQMLKEKGYTTAMFGKWHVGMTFFDEEGKAINESGLSGVKRIDYTKPSPDSPIHRGFDHFFGTVCCPTTDWLYAYVDGDRIPVPPTRQLNAEMKKENRPSRACILQRLSPGNDISRLSNGRCRPKVSGEKCGLFKES